jgi:hypothetical protein
MGRAFEVKDDNKPTMKHLTLTLLLALSSCAYRAQDKAQKDGIDALSQHERYAIRRILSHERPR